MYQVIIPKSIQKQIEKIDNKIEVKIQFSLIQLAINPYIGKKLGGELKGLWSYRISQYRILYEIKNKELLVWIFNVGHRKDVYK